MSTPTVVMLSFVLSGLAIAAYLLIRTMLGMKGEKVALENEATPEETAAAQRGLAEIEPLNKAIRDHRDGGGILGDFTRKQQLVALKIKGEKRRQEMAEETHAAAKVRDGVLEGGVTALESIAFWLERLANRDQ